MEHFFRKSKNFSLQNIDFTVEKLFGSSKYPIYVWNQLELNGTDLRINFSSQKSKLNFFLKSAISALNSSPVALQTSPNQAGKEKNS